MSAVHGRVHKETAVEYPAWVQGLGVTEGVVSRRNDHIHKRAQRQEALVAAAREECDMVRNIRHKNQSVWHVKRKCFPLRLTHCLENTYNICTRFRERDARKTQEKDASKTQGKRCTLK